MTPTLLARTLGDCIYLSKYAQKGKKNRDHKKMCVLSSICQKCQGTQIKVLLSFVIKEKIYKERWLFVFPI